MNADGAVVRDADDCGRLRLETELDTPALAAALSATDSGALGDDGVVWLDLAVLRARARLAATVQDWPRRWEALTTDARRAGRLSADGRAVAVGAAPAPSGQGRP